MVLLALQRVFRHGRYALAAALVAYAVVSAAVFLSNLSLITQVLAAEVSVLTKLSFVLSLYGSLGSNFSVFSAVLVMVTAALFGVNIALLTFYIRRRQEAAGAATAHVASIGGIVSAALGIGCAACGSVVLTALLGLLGAGGLILALPFHGVEFGVLGLILLLVSIIYLARRINDPVVCPAKQHTS